jgi:O-acetyl-ADP-ribose deacetylase (regulator of RNase III)
MSLEFVKGNMFAVNANVLVCPVNCAGAMGRGLAKRFARNYPLGYQNGPSLKEAFKAACQEKLVLPGLVWHWKAINGEIVACVPTKRHWSDRSQLNDIKSGLRGLVRFLGGREVEQLCPLRVAVPALGCGLGGLPWSKVRPLIELLFGADQVPAQIMAFEPEEGSAL